MEAIKNTTINDPHRNVTVAGVTATSDNGGLHRNTTYNGYGYNITDIPPTVELDGNIVLDMDLILYISVGVGAFIVILLIIILVCYKKKRLTETRKPVRRHHKKLCAQDSGTVSIPVQRVAGSTVTRQSRDCSPSSRAASLVRDASLNVKYSPGQVRQMGYSPSQARQSRYSPNQARQSGYSSSERHRYSPKELGHTGQPQGQLRRPTITGQDGFSISNSFEGGLDLVNGSQYDNVHEPTNIDRKGSTYDNLNEDDGSNPLIDSVQLRHLQNLNNKTAKVVEPTKQRRKSTRTLPLHFTMFDGTQYSRYQDEEEDPDYANVPTRHMSTYERRVSGAAQGNKQRPTSLAEPKPKKYKARRGSKSLKLFINRKVPPVISKIERQVLEAVPIYGEPTPGTTPKTAELALLDFPPPPVESPPQSPVRSYINAMYCPFSATPGEEQGISYFSA